MKKLANEIVEWIRDYAVESKRDSSLTVGVSGGVDSALVSTLCAMTGLMTDCVILPCQTKKDQTDRGLIHVNWLKDKFSTVVSHKIDLTTTFEAFKRETNSLYDNELAFANAKSRLRMVALYQIATVYGGLVVGTGNKVEDFGVGFFTKYGDGGVDISPIADLTKTEVRQMARELGILPELSEAVPTDGLWDDTRTDESQLGASYEELEWAMKWIEDGKNCNSTVLVEGLTSRQKDVLYIYNKWHNMGAHKLLPIPTFKRKA